MCEGIQSIVAAARELASGLDPSQLSAEDAVMLTERFAELEKIAAAGRTSAAARVAETRAWFGSGAPSPAVWMAGRTGSTIGKAVAALRLAEQLKELPTTRAAFAAGQLSEAQATEIADAAAADPAAESELHRLARRESFVALRDRCRDVIAAAAGDEDIAERIRRSRYFRHWVERDGALRLDARLAPDDGASLVAVVMAKARARAAEAAAPDQREALEAHAADALVSLAEGSGGARPVVNVLVSATALERGRTVAGETCRIEGIGPISVAAAARLASRGILRVLERDGVDVSRVAHVGRMIPARVRSALEARDPTCVVPGCNRRSGLEIDHVVPLIEGGTTSLGNLARLCRWHHAQKTHHGWRLEGEPGEWSFSRPEPLARGP